MLLVVLSQGGGAKVLGNVGFININEHETFSHDITVMNILMYFSIFVTCVCPHAQYEDL